MIETLTRKFKNENDLCVSRKTDEENNTEQSFPTRWQKGC